MNKLSDSDIEHKLQSLIEGTNRYFDSYSKFVKDLSDEQVAELDKYIHYLIRSHHKESVLNMDKMKIFISLMNLSDDDAKRILSYLKSTEYGWQGNEYILSNPCLRFSLNQPYGHCKWKSTIPDVDAARDAFEKIYDVFLNGEYGQVTLLIFNYCLAALFSKKLNEEHFTIPFFLQIACDRGSILYQLIEEIVDICDVNSGLFKSCTNLDHAYCGYKHQIHYPTQSVAKDLDDLIYNSKDIPAIIAGYENERYYNALLREIANIPNKKNILDLRDRFNILPIFICPMIKSSFDNIFDIDLTDFEVDKEYLNLLRKNKQMLASWVLDLVTNFDDRLLPHMNEYEKSKSPFSSSIGAYINYVSQKYTALTLNNAQNVGFLNFFFKGYMRTFNRLCTFSIDKEFACFETGGKELYQTREKNIFMLIDRSEQILADLHQRYLPAPSGIGVNDKGAVRLAKQIEKNYRALKVFIRVTPSIVKKDRYIFNVDTLQETKDADIVRNIETIQRRMKKYEYFRVDLSDKKSIKLIVAEKPLEDNNLIEILKHNNFTNSKKKIPYAVGYDETGAMFIQDIEDFPHLLLAGATQSGKSTAMISLLMSIAYKHRTGDVSVLIIDLLGKIDSDFAIFNNQPFLSSPVITTPMAGLVAILALYKEMQNRLQDKNLPNFPYIVCVIDEFPRLFSDIDKSFNTDLEEAMSKLLSMGRHAKIHLVLAVQDPQKKHIVYGIGNISTRIALRCSHYQNSMMILGASGADKLIGKGQMIFKSRDFKEKRLQGSFIPQADMKKLLDEIKETFEQKNKYPFILDIDSTLIESNTDTTDNSKPLHAEDEKLADAIMWTLSQNNIANSRLQAYFHVANNRANRILNRLEALGLIKRLNGNRGWEVKPSCIEDMSIETISLLEAYGLTENDIQKVFDAKSPTTEKVEIVEELITGLPQDECKTPVTPEIKNNAEAVSVQSQKQEMEIAINNVGKILNRIEDIVFQSNILALNAAVETNKAGEHGKGFAKIAEEVRDLATRSSKAAQEAAEIIEQLFAAGGMK